MNVLPPVLSMGAVFDEICSFTFFNDGAVQLHPVCSHLHRLLDSYWHHSPLRLRIRGGNRERAPIAYPFERMSDVRLYFPVLNFRYIPQVYECLFGLGALSAGGLRLEMHLAGLQQSSLQYLRDDLVALLQSLQPNERHLFRLRLHFPAGVCHRVRRFRGLPPFASSANHEQVFQRTCTLLQSGLLELVGGLRQEYRTHITCIYFDDIVNTDVLVFTPVV